MNNHVIDILLAEDSDDDVVMIRKAFEEGKMVNIIQVVKDGEEVLAYLRREGRYKDAVRPGLLLLDIGMPKMNGFEVLRAIKADPELKGLPVVILTTSQREEDIAKSYRDGACSYITKPIGLEAFRDMVKKFEFYWALVARIPDSGR